MRATALLLILAATATACDRDAAPNAEPAEATPPGLLSSDSAAEIPAPADNAATADVPDADKGVPGVPDVGRDPSTSAPARAGSGPSPQVDPPGEQEAPTSQDSDAAAILRRASSAYEGVRSLQADFTMTREIPALRQTVTSRGRLYQRGPDRIALRFTEPDGDAIVGDGQFFWVYYPSVNDDQVMRFPAGESGRSGVDLKAQFVGDPVRRFEATLHGTETVGGRTASVLTLVPRERAEYRSLKVWLDTRDSLARRFEIVEHNGSRRRFDLSDMRTNAPIPDATFRFTPPAGARVIDAGN